MQHWVNYQAPCRLVAMIGTSDQPCWLVEACTSLLLLLAAMANMASISGAFVLAWWVCRLVQFENAEGT